MGNDLKSTWKETGKELGHAFKGLGKSIVKTGSKAMKKADEWANREDAPAAEAPKNEESAPAQTSIALESSEKTEE